MLILERKLDEIIDIGGDITVKVASLSRTRVHLAITAPDDIRVDRREVTESRGAMRAALELALPLHDAEDACRPSDPDMIERGHQASVRLALEDRVKLLEDRMRAMANGPARFGVAAAASATDALAQSQRIAARARDGEHVG